MTTKTETKTAPNASFCKASPTGAHHWVLGAPSVKMAGECKYCHAAREFRPFEENIGFNNSPKRPRSAAQTAGE